MKANAELVDAARTGSAEAIAQLLEVCQPDLKRFARKTCSNAEDAEDAVQLALWKLYRKIGALRTAATFAVWMFRIVERECFRLFRGGRRSAMDGDHDVGALAALAVPVDLRLDLSRAIGALPAAYREVLILRDVDELTAPEVAQQLGVSVEAVKSRLHRARGMVRTTLMASGYWADGQLPSHTPSSGDQHVL
ncbi:MAG TPA: sigma-70 family RNA polymerase sigma factor [Polaromonas sp.]|uniref:RNA polymerase sigma factor n=1 Tax=Polaromonas sp. TaxID=1869339 RepID=UPI002D62AC65|nr:sigma-70 family RNA polymerase sigma factor [Polaromonas sp.]HYW55387.1 sigma-70 family RNA polymerase sigma factor [Polaromonas sp.]